jgi:hypothetical protein
MISFAPHRWYQALVASLLAAILAFTASLSQAAEPVPTGRPSWPGT